MQTSCAVCLSCDSGLEDWRSWDQHDSHANSIFRRKQPMLHLQNKPEYCQIPLPVAQVTNGGFFSLITLQTGLLHHAPCPWALENESPSHRSRIHIQRCSHLTVKFGIDVTLENLSNLPGMWHFSSGYFQLSVIWVCRTFRRAHLFTCLVMKCHTFTAARVHI